MKCHAQCGACCIAPEISSPLPNMPSGKPAGTPCLNLNLTALKCECYDERPKVCREFQPAEYSCGSSHTEAIQLIGEIEQYTKH